jgi:hypothetical protein
MRTTCIQIAIIWTQQWRKTNACNNKDQRNVFTTHGRHTLYGTWLYESCYPYPRPLVCDIKNWIFFAIFFSPHNKKCHHKFIKLSKLMDIKNNKIFKNIKMCWISMLSPTKWKFVEYKTLFTSMVRDVFSSPN